MEISLIIFRHLTHNVKPTKGDTPLVTVRDISQGYGISENFVAKIMQALCREELLASKQGVQGGYHLKIDLGKLTFFELLERLEGEFNLVNCFKSDQSCNYQVGCNIINPMKQLDQKFRDFYRSLKVSELIEIPYAPYTNSNEKKEGKTEGVDESQLNKVN